MPTPNVVRFRADPRMRRQLDRLREEKSINISSWLRRLVQQGLAQEFPNEATVATEGPEQPPARAADAHETGQKQKPGVATETTETDAQTTPAEVAETPQNDPNASPSVATEGPEQPPARVADAHETGQKQKLGVATETTETDAQTTPSEDTPQMAPIPGWKPCKFPDGQWGALLKGPGVAGLPDDNQLPGTPIVVTDKRGESWTTTLTEVVDRTDNAIVVKDSGRWRS